MTTPTEVAAKINKRLGEDTIITGAQLLDTLKNAPRERLSTGLVSIDQSFGGGWIVGQVQELIGNESHGKTALALNTIAYNMLINPGFEAVWVASEDFDPVWAQQFVGFDLSRIYVVLTNVMEDAYQTILDYAEERAVDMIVLDSLPALVPSGEVEKRMDEPTMTLGARLTSAFLRRAGKAMRRSLTETDRPCTFLVINQWRDDIGGFSRFGPAKTTPGGKAKNFHYHLRAEVKRDEWITVGPHKVGICIKTNTIKNKSYPVQRSATVDFYYAPGNGFEPGQFDYVKDTMNAALALEVVERRGGYYHFNGQRWQGKDAYAAAVKFSPELQAQLRTAVLSAGAHNIEDPRPEPEVEPEPVKRRVVKKK